MLIPSCKAVAMSEDINAEHWSLKLGGCVEANAIPTICGISIFKASFAASSRKLPVPAEHASFMA